MSDNPLDFWSNPPSTTVVGVEPDVMYGKSEDIRVKKNICYVVCGIILRGSKDDAEVLMIQEVRNDWYLPAGRLEAGETIEDGMKREVKEEAGIECESLGLIAVDTVRPAWYRFVYLAKQSGGVLKTPDQRDQESIQGAWIRVDQLLNGGLSPEFVLRSRDILRLIRIAMLRQFGECAQQPPLYCAKTIERPLLGLFIRFVLVSGNKVLLRRRQFPLVEHALMHHVAAIAAKFIGSLTNAQCCDSTDFKVISVEALPIPSYQHDGSCLTLLIEMSASTLNQHAEEDGYQWVDFSSDKVLSDFIEFWRKNYAVLCL